MLVTRNLYDNTFDSLFDGFFRTPTLQSSATHMNTDIQDLGDNYQMEMELPGYDKKEVKADLKNGYLTVTAEHKIDKEEKDEDSNFIRRERYQGSCRRSFYVGEYVTKEDIKASFENGVLKLLIPKKDSPALIEKQYIAIE